MTVTHIRSAAALSILAALCACGSKEERKPDPVPTYASPKAAEEKGVPAALKVDYQRLLECEMAKRVKAGRTVEIDTETVADLTRRVKAGERAQAGCR